MGCDIHLFVERSTDEGYRGFAEGRFPISRDYALFGALAGVRGHLDALIAARGIPDDVSPEVFDLHYERIATGEQERDRGLELLVTADQAQRFAERGVELLPAGARKGGLARPDPYIADPDAHHASHLTRDEVLRCLDHADYSLERAPATFAAVLCAMAELERREGCTTRIVFWFDN